ncbi:MLP-like protein 423 [Acorus gramineus]|uniref:MLP-like protein 423 n=1 Tax=Acorus gramineus TaxID=55184 RepID=A0AAV9AYG0_ACOGR|nr:MLP-like protein 423 [Acorus gramineus]
MAGKLELEVVTKSSADKFWGAIRNSSELFPRIFPEQFKSIEIVEGDGQSVGSVRLVKYAEGVPIVTFTKEKLEIADEENKTVSYTVIDGELATLFKSFKATLHVVPRGEGALVKWNIEYDKASDEVPDPNLVQETAKKTFTDLDEYLLKN